MTLARSRAILALDGFGLPESIVKILLVVPPVLIALTVHEFAHGWVAWRLGDPTAKDRGRLTLNPIAHLDPLGTLLLIFFYFGWAKPVPVNPYNFQNPRIGMVWVAIAGPAANILLATGVGLLMQFLLGVDAIYPGGIVYFFLMFTVFINLMLALFNLLPIPPLDGSKVVGGLLPQKYLHLWVGFEKIGFFVIVGLILVGRITSFSIFGSTIFPVARYLYGIVTGNSPSIF